MPNPSHILISSAPGAFRYEEEAERSPAKVWKRPWLLPRFEDRVKTLTIVNDAVQTPQGPKHFTPFQVALAALQRGVTHSYDKIRVKTPALEGMIGGKSQADVVFMVADLKAKFHETVPAPTVRKNTVRVEQEGADHPLAGSWTLTDSNVMTKVE